MQRTFELHKIEMNEKDYLIWREDIGGGIEIVDIAVYSERGNGTGGEMLNQLDKSKRIYAFCRSDNAPAHKFYKKHGFVGYELKNFYAEGNAYIFIYEANK